MCIFNFSYRAFPKRSRLWRTQVALSESERQRHPSLSQPRMHTVIRFIIIIIIKPQKRYSHEKRKSLFLSVPRDTQQPPPSSTQAVPFRFAIDPSCSIPVLRRKDSLLLHRLHERLQRDLGLIIRHLVPRAEHPEEAEVAGALERAHLLPVDGVGLQRLALERRLLAVLHRVGDRVAAGPVADPVGVAGPHEHLDAALHHAVQGGD